MPYAKNSIIIKKTLGTVTITQKISGSIRNFVDKSLLIIKGPQAFILKSYSSFK